MGSKNISLKDEAYERLKALKTEDKSFSDLIMELTEDEDSVEKENIDGKEGFEQLIGADIDTTAEELIEERRKTRFIDEDREELISK